MEAFVKQWNDQQFDDMYQSLTKDVKKKSPKRFRQQV